VRFSKHKGIKLHINEDIAQNKTYQIYKLHRTTAKNTTIPYTHHTFMGYKPNKIRHNPTLLGYLTKAISLDRTHQM